jgi:hypothetical protein
VALYEVAASLNDVSIPIYRENHHVLMTFDRYRLKSRKWINHEMFIFSRWIRQQYLHTGHDPFPSLSSSSVYVYNHCLYSFQFEQHNRRKVFRYKSLISNFLELNVGWPVLSILGLNSILFFAANAVHTNRNMGYGHGKRPPTAYTLLARTSVHAYPDRLIDLSCPHTQRVSNRSLYTVLK